MNKTSLAYFSFIISIAVLIPVVSVKADVSVYLHNIPDEKYDTIPVYLHSGMGFLSLSDFCKSLGIEWTWDMYTERFIFFRKSDTGTVIQNNNFYQINDSSFQLASPPVRLRGDLYLDQIGINEVFGHLKDSKITWSRDKRMFTLAKHDIDEKEFGKIEEATESIEKPEKSDKQAVESKIEISDKSSENYQIGPKQRIKTIVIDPGHGGKDPGAIGSNGLKEKDVVLEVGLALRDFLKEDTTLNIFLTRSTDVFIPLRQRTKFANDKKADLFVSIHANSIAGSKKRKNSIKGYKIYFLSHAKNEDDKLAAMIENSVIELEEDVQKVDYIQNILIDMANNEFLAESQDLSILIAESFGKCLNKIKSFQKGVGQANFWVLNGAYMPSVLVETCFISNLIEEKLLENKKFRKKLGDAIGNAVVKFKKKYEAGL